MQDLTSRTFAREQLIPLLFRLSDRLDKRRHDLASAVREFTVRLQDAAGDANPIRASRDFTQKLTPVNSPPAPVPWARGNLCEATQR